MASDASDDPPLRDRSTLIAAALERGARLRVDVSKARIRVAEDNPSILLVDVRFLAETGCRHLHREASLTRLNLLREGAEPSVARILDAWLGPEPTPETPWDDGRRVQRERGLFRRLYDACAAQAARTPPTEATPASELTWKRQPRPIETPVGTLSKGPPDPRPPGPRRDGDVAPAES